MSKNEYIIVRHSESGAEDIRFTYENPEPGERPMALDVLLSAQEQSMPDLAYRYGWRGTWW